jgi:hypothetical protein
MGVNEDFKKNILYKASYAVVLCGLLWWGVMEYCRVNAPIAPDESIGSIYPMNFHGDIVYLNETENFLRYFLPGIGFFVFFSLIIIDQYIWDWVKNKFSLKKGK